MRFEAAKPDSVLANQRLRALPDLARTLHCTGAKRSRNAAAERSSGSASDPAPAQLS
jgi:hypothetical protein